MGIFYWRFSGGALSWCWFAPVLLVYGCGGMRTATPLESTLEKSSCTLNADTLLVLLPGAYCTQDELRARVSSRRQSDNRLWPLDAMLVDAHLGYYNNKTILDQLSKDVMAPAREQGLQVDLDRRHFGRRIRRASTRQSTPANWPACVTIAPYLGNAR